MCAYAVHVGECRCVCVCVCVCTDVYSCVVPFPSPFGIFSAQVVSCVLMVS